MEKPKYSVILPLFGRYEMLTLQLQAKVEQLKGLGEDIEIILVLDGPQWSSVPMIQLLTSEVKRLRLVALERPVHLPAKLFNVGIAQALGEYIIFSTLYGTNLCTTAGQFQKCIEGKQPDQAKRSTEYFLTAKKPAYYIRPQAARECEYFLSGALYGQCQTMDVLHIDEWCVPRDLWEQLGGFNESPWLQEEFERYAALSFLRLGAAQEAYVLPTELASRSLRFYPFQKRLAPDRDLARRWAIYCNAVAYPGRTPECCTEQFQNDLAQEEAALFCAVEGREAAPKERKPGIRYRIFIIGGYWEYHHNQIVFYNYLENLYGSGFATFRCGLDVDTEAPELIGYDLVIFTRCKSDRSITLMEFCRERRIPTLYMIDDNWFSIAKDHPDYGGMFIPGSPDYDNFIRALGLCKSTMVFNPVLRRDVLPYAANVQTFPVSVCAKTFSCDVPRVRRDDELYVGFSGSLRWDDMAFRALARLARRRRQVKLLLVGTLSKEQEMLFTGLPVIRLPQMDYAKYAGVMSQLQPDVLVAPLDKTHTAQSKCPNKYLESAIVGAACVFSKTEPYLSVVKDGVNGFFVTDESDEGWYQCLERVVGNVPQLRRVQKRAREDVLAHYSVEKLLPLFRQKISAIIEREELEDD